MKSSHARRIARPSRAMGRVLWFTTALLLASVTPAFAEIKWVHVSSAKGQVPNPGGSNQQTGALVGKFDNGPADGVIISYRVHAPALVWMRRTANGWQRYVIEKDFLRLEAGGAAYDIDGDGDLDVVFGEDIRGKNSTGGKIPHRTSTLMFRGRATSSSRRGRTSITIRYSLISKERASLSLFSGISARRRCSSRRSLQIRRPRLPGRWRRST
jgi:hypothetical protein